jgi:hypothetical protein
MWIFHDHRRKARGPPWFALGPAASLPRINARLADRLLDGSMTPTDPIPPGAAAPVAGTYELSNDFGFRTGLTYEATRGETLPRAYGAFYWSLLIEGERKE